MLTNYQNRSNEIMIIIIYSLLGSCNLLQMSFSKLQLKVIEWNIQEYWNVC